MNLICPVRACRVPLVREPSRLVCENGHSFDIARSGYINLLQPQERRSKQPGDTPSAVAARRRLHDGGITAPLLDAIAKVLAPVAGERLLDAGCGDGFYLGSLASRTALEAHGIDIATAAIDAAARRYPACEWVVGNADRFLPYAPQTFSAILSVTARRNALEFHRVLKPDGRLLVAIPAPGDLIELRGKGRERSEDVTAALAPFFGLVHASRVTTEAQLDARGVADVLEAIYRPLQPITPLPMRLTLSLDLLLFQPAHMS